MNLVNIFIDRPRILILTLVFILLAGASSYISIPRQENPELAQRWASVIVIDPGSSAARLETQVITKLESGLQEIIEIKELDVNIQAGFAQMVVEGENDPGATVHSPEQHPNTVFRRSWKVHVPQYQFPVQCPSLCPKWGPKVPIGLVPSVHESLQMVACNEFMVHGRP